jgi:transcriptional regulator with XRE-family HTH domain
VSIKNMKKNNTKESLGNLGQKLKQVRNHKKLTLDQLSQMAGVSKAMLSQIEQGNVNPTVAVIIKITQSLGLQVSELLETEQKQNILRIISASEDRYTFKSDALCNIRTLSPLELEKAIEFYKILLEPNGQLNSEAHFAGTEEILYLEKGKLEIVSGNQNTIINKGDSIHYRADVPHIIKNIGKGAAEAFMIVRYCK